MVLDRTVSGVSEGFLSAGEASGAEVDAAHAAAHAHAHPHAYAHAASRRLAAVARSRGR